MYKNETLKSVSTFLTILEPLIEVIILLGFVLSLSIKGVPDSVLILNDLQDWSVYHTLLVITLFIRFPLIAFRQYLLNRGIIVLSGVLTLLIISITGGILTFFLKIDHSSPKEREKKFIEKEYKLGHISEEQYLERLESLERK